MTARYAGLILNLFVRITVLYFLGEVLLFPNDPRFAGKAIPIRNFVIVVSLSFLFPVFHFLRRRWSRYPLWLDSLYLSIFWLDMAGNSFDLYDRHRDFDLIAPIRSGPFAPRFWRATRTISLKIICHLRIWCCLLR